MHDATRTDARHDQNQCTTLLEPMHDATRNLSAPAGLFCPLVPSGLTKVGFEENEQTIKEWIYTNNFFQRMPVENEN